MRPHIVKQVSDQKEVIMYEPTLLSQPISEETADIVADMLRSVVREGDAKEFFNKYLNEYDIAGKTGT